MEIKFKITHLEGLPALVVQFGHLLLDPCGNVGNGHVDDIFQQDGKVLQAERGVLQGAALQSRLKTDLIRLKKCCMKKKILIRG